MPRFNCEVAMKGAAFDPDEGAISELTRILRDVIKRLEDGEVEYGQLVDANGNSCGTYNIDYARDNDEEAVVVDDCLQCGKEHNVEEMTKVDDRVDLGEVFVCKACSDANRAATVAPAADSEERPGRCPECHSTKIVYGEEYEKYTMWVKPYECKACGYKGAEGWAEGELTFDGHYPADYF